MTRWPQSSLPRRPGLGHGIGLPSRGAAYQAPFPSAASRLPIWRLANELPIEGQPADVYAALTTAHDALRHSRYPKLLFAGSPGALVSPVFADAFAATLVNCEAMHLPSGGRAVAEWITAITLRATSRGTTIDGG